MNKNKVRLINVNKDIHKYIDYYTQMTMEQKLERCIQETLGRDAE